MLGPQQVMQEALFYEFSLDGHVPPDHLLRRTDALMDFSEVRRHLAPFYSAIGRPSIDPEPYPFLPNRGRARAGAGPLCDAKWRRSKIGMPHHASGLGVCAWRQAKRPQRSAGAKFPQRNPWEWMGSCGRTLGMTRLLKPGAHIGCFYSTRRQPKLSVEGKAHGETKAG